MKLGKGMPFVLPFVGAVWGLVFWAGTTLGQQPRTSQKAPQEVLRRPVGAKPTRKNEDKSTAQDVVNLGGLFPQRKKKSRSRFPGDVRNFFHMASWSRTRTSNCSGHWRVEDLRRGMKGHGLTVVKGTKIEKFHAEVLGIMKNTNPGRDMILCRLAGCNLEKTGVIAGMSGSPIYIHGKLVGAVAYAWPFGKEPIAGVTPFCQMKQYAKLARGSRIAGKGQSRKISLGRSLQVSGKRYDSVTVSDYVENPKAMAADGLWLRPLRTPLAATGFSKRSLSLLRDQLKDFGMVPVQGGGVTSQVAEEENQTPLVPGGALTVALITGDFDLSGIGTVTHIEGNNVYGWGHPFMSMGQCNLPLMTGYVHTIYPRQNLSFKMGSPLRVVGSVQADVSTCIAGRLGPAPEMLPIRMTVRRGRENKAKTFNVQVVREPQLLANLVFTSLTNSIDMEGDLPEELTFDLKAEIELEGHKPIILEDTFSGMSYSAGRAPRVLFGHVAAIVSALTSGDHEPLTIKKINCTTVIRPVRQTAEIEAIELQSQVVRPGETLKVDVLLRPYKAALRRIPVTLRVPKTLPEGEYTAYICTDTENVRRKIRSRPQLARPLSQEDVLKTLRLKSGVRRNRLVIRLPRKPHGVALEGTTLPDLPASMVHILANSRRSGVQTMRTALVSVAETPWVISGSEAVTFRVIKNKKVLER
ncbi:MAG: SpoIVB peptidase S55 domain-containing protein [Gemmataceae bacterium]